MPETLTMSRWKYGCGRKFERAIPTRYSSRLITVECGSTAHDGGVNQCDACGSRDDLRPPPTPTYGDDDHVADE